MEDKQIRIALSMIVKGTDDEAIVLDRCLAASAEHVDGIFLTITGKEGEEPNAACVEIGKKYNADLSFFTWVNDFAAARNFSLAQIPKDFSHWTWLDCDDVPRHYDKLRTTVAAHPELDSFIFNYLYQFDENNNPIVVHMKTRVLKHDDSVHWAGALHEDFAYDRDLQAAFIEGIDIMHLTDQKRVDDSTARNLAVALEQLAKLPDDPRSYWNAANALRMTGKDNEAIAMFEEFMRRSESDDEKFVVHMRAAEIRMSQGQPLLALEHARYAIGMRPDYPDAYHLAGHCFFAAQRYEDARDMFQRGLTKKPAYNKVIVYNPRDYDLHPMMALAKTYFQLSMPQLAVPLLEACLEVTPDDKHLEATIATMKKESEKVEKIMQKVVELSNINDNVELWKELEKIPDDFQSHPGICQLRNTRFVKKESSGKDLVIYCAFTEEEWSPETARTKGIGGSEEAVIHLSKRLVDRGWNVTVYNNCGFKELNFDGVKYKPFWSWNYRDKQDVTIVWRHPKALDYGINSDRIYLDMHDVIPPGEFTEKRLAQLTKIFVKSKAHRILFPKVPDNKFVVIPNGIVWDDLNSENKLERDPMLLLNTSSPDRSLSALIDMYEEIKRRVPEAKLKWCYGWSGWDREFLKDPKKKAWKDGILARMRLLGVEELGRVSHQEVAELYQQASIFAYPTAFYEIDCISARKAQAAGAYPVVTDFAALNETVKFGDRIHVNPEEENWGKPFMTDFAIMGTEARKAWIEAVVKQLQSPLTEENRVAMREWTKKFSWESITDNWNDELCRNLN